MGYGIIIGEKNKTSLIAETELKAYFETEKVYYRKDIVKLFHLEKKEKYSLYYGSLILTNDCNKEEMEEYLKKGLYIYFNDFEAKLIDILEVKIFPEYETSPYHNTKRIPCVVLCVLTKYMEKEILNKKYVSLLKIQENIIKYISGNTKNRLLKKLFFPRKIILALSEKIKNQKEDKINMGEIDISKMKKLSEEVK